jgi:diguanylate cyclase (GGDEF)-like protein
MQMYYEILQIKDQLLSSLKAENLSAVLLLGGAAFVVFIMSLYLKKKIRTSYKHPMRFFTLVFFLLFLMPYFFVSFVVFYAPLHAITYPPDLLTVSIILGGICLFYSVISLTKISVRILRHEAGRMKANKLDSEQTTLVDRLTGQYNEAGFITMIEHHIRLAKRDKRKVFMLYVKIDKLKQLYDKFGYQGRDMAILETSKLLTSTCRDSDIIARVSEDSFLIFLIGCTKDNAGGISIHFQEMYDTMNARRNKKYRVPIRYCVVDYSPQYTYKFDNILAQAEELLLLQTNSTVTNLTVNC